MRGDDSVKDILRTVYDLPYFTGIVLTMDDKTAERYAVILNGLWAAGTPIPTNDMWIAASAMQYGLTVVITNAHFLKITQILVNHRSPAR